MAQRQSIPTARCGNCGTAVVGETASWGEGRICVSLHGKGTLAYKTRGNPGFDSSWQGMPATKHRSNLMESLDNTQSFALPNDPGGGLVQRPSGRGWMG